MVSVVIWFETMNMPRTLLYSLPFPAVAVVLFALLNVLFHRRSTYPYI